MLDRDYLTPEDAKRVGELFRQLREQNHLHPSQITAFLGISRLTLTRLENGERLFPENCLKFLVAAARTEGDAEEVANVVSASEPLAQVWKVFMLELGRPEGGVDLQTLRELAKRFEGSGGGAMWGNRDQLSAGIRGRGSKSGPRGTVSPVGFWVREYLADVTGRGRQAGQRHTSGLSAPTADGQSRAVEK